MRPLNAFAGFCLFVASTMSLTVHAQCTDPDTEAPVITNMPSDISQSAEAGLCGANVSWTIPNVTDNCEVSYFKANHEPDDFYAVGITTVTYTALDVTGNLTALSFTITISDDEAPSISDMPDNISESSDGDACSTAITWDSPTADDNCNIASLTSDRDSGDTFDVGVHTVTYTATDVNGNSTEDSFTVTVADNTNPIVITQNITIQLDGTGLASIAANQIDNGSTDACGIATYALDNSDFDCGDLGENTVTLTVQDIHGNSATGTATVTVEDSEAPVIEQLTVASVGATGSCAATVNWSEPTVSDNCTINSSLSSDIASGASFDVGISPVTYTYTDDGGNEVNMTFNVTVTDEEAPVITGMPSNITQGTDENSCMGTVTWEEPSATDNCTLATIGGDYDPGDEFPEGETEVIYTAIDIYGKTSTASFTITITSNDSDSDGICDNGDNCSNTSACNFADPANVDCIVPEGCETCSNTLGTGSIVDNDADDDGVCNDDEIAGCQDATACNYNAAATDGGIDCTYTDGVCETCSGTTDGSGTVIDNDADDDGVCNQDEIVGCQDAAACNYNAAATDHIQTACSYTLSVCETCSGATDGSGTVIDNDADDDGVCNQDEIAGCQDAAACNYNAAATDGGIDCTYTDGVCETCSGATDGSGTVLDNDADDDGVCNQDEIAGCQDATACNYNSNATDPADCTFPTGCETCSGETDGSGTIVDNDADNDGVCDANEVAGCQDDTACNYNSAATDFDNSCIYTSNPCDSCSGATDGSGTVVDNDADDDGICNEDETDRCTDPSACNYDADPNVDSDNTLCVYATGPCESCSGETDGSGTVEENDADNDGVCDQDEVVGCQDSEACNYNSDATDSADCTFPTGCETCSGQMDGSGTVVDNDADNDGVCDANEVAGCQDDTACNYNSAATDDDESCIYTSTACETCSGQIDGSGTVLANDTDNDGVCDSDEIAGCQDDTACNYNSAATDADNSCTYTSNPCDTCSGATDGTGTVIDNDADDDGICNDDDSEGCTDPTACNAGNFSDTDNSLCQYAIDVNNGIENLDCDGNCYNDSDDDGVCDEDEVAGCTNENACNYNSNATDEDDSCIYPVDTYGIDYVDCDGECLDDADDDGVCDQDEVVGCQDATACNYNSDATDPADCAFPTGCDTCSGATDGSGTVIDNDADNDGICDDNEVEGCEDNSACNYNDAATDSDGSCVYVTDPCDACSGETDGTGTVVAWAGDLVSPTIDNIPENINLTVAQGECTAQATWETVTADDNCGIASFSGDIPSGTYFGIGTTTVIYTATDSAGFTATATFTVTVADNDYDGDSIGDCDDPDVDGDGASNINDSDDFNEFICSDDDGDGCDDCSSGAYNIATDGPDSDGDGICDDGDNCSDPLANNYLDPANGECENCPNAPIFNSIDPVTPASTMSSLDGAIALDISGNFAATLYLTGVNGAPDYELDLSSSNLDNLEAGYYMAMIQDDEGCWGVSDTSVGGTTLQQPAICLELIIPFKLCCSGCGINDIDADGVCDDDDNCTDQSAPNFADPANTDCIEP